MLLCIVKHKTFCEDKAKALLYIYTSDCLFCQKLGADPIRQNDDNIILEDSTDDGGTLSNMDDDNNDDNGDKGHDGDDRDASDGGEEHCREYTPTNLGNVHQECSFNWNDINDEIENGNDGYTAIEPIGNMYVNEDAPVGS